MTRGERNNNPGNIRVSNQLWLGKIIPSSDPDFEQFDTPEHGIRAIAKIILSDFHHGINTITGIITRWAPQSDNNPTAAYIENVSGISGYDPDSPLLLTSLDDLWPVVKGIITQENGECTYSNLQIQDSCQMALLS